MKGLDADMKADVIAVGAILYQMCTNTVIDDNKLKQAAKSNKNHQNSIDLPDELNDGLKIVIVNMLQK